MATAKSSAPLSAIKGYTFTPREIKNYGGWNAETKTLTPLDFTSGDMEASVYVVLDTLVLATEAGVMREFDWPQQLFANLESFEEFISELEGYDNCYRVTDQWWKAIAEITGGEGDEEGLVLSSELADELFKSAAAFGRIGNFGRKPGKYHFEYTQEQCIQAQLDQAKNSAAYGTWLSHEKAREVSEIVEFSGYFDTLAPLEQRRAASAEGTAYREAAENAEKSAKKAAKAAKAKAPAAKKTAKSK